jgi:hypothetical protein
MYMTDLCSTNLYVIPIFWLSVPDEDYSNLLTECTCRLFHKHFLHTRLDVDICIILLLIMFMYLIWRFEWMFTLFKWQWYKHKSILDITAYYKDKSKWLVFNWCNYLWISICYKIILWQGSNIYKLWENYTPIGCSFYCCQHGKCINMVGSYICMCNKGYKTDITGTRCIGL